MVKSGTSMATPIVSGAIADLISEMSIQCGSQAQTMSSDIKGQITIVRVGQLNIKTFRIIPVDSKTFLYDR